MPDWVRPPEDVAQELELAGLIVSTLNLKIRPSDIDRDAPLLEDGLGLDSVDTLEIALAIAQVYGVQVRSDDEETQDMFSSLRGLNRYVQNRRLK
jgi:acyl carrier protein